MEFQKCDVNEKKKEKKERKNEQRKTNKVAKIILSRSGGEKGLRGSGAGTLGVPLGGTRRVGGLLVFSLTLYF